MDSPDPKRLYRPGVSGATIGLDMPDFLLLGPFEVRDGERVVELRRKKHRALLAFLALRAG